MRAVMHELSLCTRRPSCLNVFFSYLCGERQEQEEISGLRKIYTDLLWQREISDARSYRFLSLSAAIQHGGLTREEVTAVLRDGGVLSRIAPRGMVMAVNVDFPVPDPYFDLGSPHR